MWSWAIFIISLVLLITSCITPANAAIPSGTPIQREPTYDDIVNCGPGVETYRINCDAYPFGTADLVKQKLVTLTGCIYYAEVGYRDYIETKIGQTRYNIFFISNPDAILRTIGFNFFRRYDHQIINYELKLVSRPHQILVENIGEDSPGFSFGTGDVRIFIMLDITPEAKIGDYSLIFALEANGLFCGELPCTIHVIE